MIGDEENPACVALPGPPSLKEEPKDETVDCIVIPESISIFHPSRGANEGVANNEDETNQKQGSKDDFVDYDDEEGDNNSDDDTKANQTSQEIRRSTVDFPFFSIVVIIFFGLAVIGGIKALARESADWKGLEQLGYIRFFGGYRGGHIRSVPLFTWVHIMLLVSIIVLVCAIKDCCCGKPSYQKEDFNAIEQPEGFEAIGEKVTVTQLGNYEEIAAEESSSNSGDNGPIIKFPFSRAVESSRRSCCREVGTVFLLLCVPSLQWVFFWVFNGVMWLPIVGFVVPFIVTLLLRWKMKRNDLNLQSPNKRNCTIAFRTSYWLSVWIFISCSFFGSGAMLLDTYLIYAFNDFAFLVYCGIFCTSMIAFMIRIVKWRKAYIFGTSDTVDEKNNNENIQGDDTEHNKNISMVYINDLCILLVGSGLGCPICTLITGNDTWVSMLVFLAIVILPTLLWVLLKYLRACALNSPNSTTWSASSEIKKSKPQNFPEDTYSFLAVYSWKQNNNLFSFGLTVFLFQTSLLGFMILSALFPRFRTGEIDNPDSEDTFMGFFPTNAISLVRATQCVSILAFSLFPQASLSDITQAIKLFPRGNLQGDKELQGLALSCILRFVQGLLSVLAVFLLVMTSSEVSEVVLNYTAVNFISEMDEIGFQLAESGYYGRALKDASNDVKKKKIPRSHDKRMHCGIGQAYSNAAVALFLLILTVCTIYSQEASKKWTTDVVRVQFESKEGSISKYRQYDGCYKLDKNKPNGKRHFYRSHQNNEGLATIGYCDDERRWFLYSGDTSDPCAAFDGGLEIARSPKSDFFDIESATEEQWLNPVNIPIGLSFITHVDDLQETCDSFYGDKNGKCDAAFNFATYNYDNGDCCAHSCENEERCGKGAEGYGDDETIYPDCFRRIGMDTIVTIAFRFDIETPIFHEIYRYGNFTLANPIIFDCDGKTVFRIRTVGFAVTSVVPLQSKCSLSTNATEVKEYYVYMTYEYDRSHDSDQKSSSGLNFWFQKPVDRGELIFNETFPSDGLEKFEIISKEFTPKPTNVPTRRPTLSPTRFPTRQPSRNPTKPL